MENLESHGILVKVMESPGKAMSFQKIKRQKDKKFEKITHELEKGFSFSRNEDKHVLYAINAGKFVIFDTTVRTNLNFHHGKLSKSHGKSHGILKS